MESDTQTNKSLDIKNLIKEIGSIEKILPENDKSKGTFPYIELYNNKYRTNKINRPKIFTLELHKKMFDLNKKVKDKEEAYFHAISLNYKKTSLRMHNYLKKNCNLSFNQSTKNNQSSKNSISLSISCTNKKVLPKISKEGIYTGKRKSMLSDIEIIGYRNELCYNDNTLRKFQIPSLCEIIETNR